jgi:hypothetical protein
MPIELSELVEEYYKKLNKLCSNISYVYANGATEELLQIEHTLDGVLETNLSLVLPKFPEYEAKLNQLEIDFKNKLNHEPNPAEKCVIRFNRCVAKKDCS